MRSYLPPGATGNRSLIELPDGADVTSVLEAIGAPARSVVAILVDGEKATPETRLHEDAEVLLMPPFSGGAIAGAVVTVSDGVAAGKREDRSGEGVARMLEEHGFDVRERVVVPDELDAIEVELRRLVEEGVDVVCTTGGTGLGPRDITPEATRRVLEREAPGIAEVMRLGGLSETKHAALSRGTAGAAGATLIINLPGSPRGAITSLAAVVDILEHAVALLAGHTRHHEEAQGH